MEEKIKKEDGNSNKGKEEKEILPDNFGTFYMTGFWIVWIPVFFGVWIYTISSWGILTGVIIGWIVSVIVAAIVGFLWPLIVVVILIFLLVIFANR